MKPGQIASKRLRTNTVELMQYATPYTGQRRGVSGVDFQRRLPSRSLTTWKSSMTLVKMLKPSRGKLKVTGDWTSLP